MMGWVIMGVLTIGTAAFVLFRSQFPREIWQILGAFLMLGLAGYAWQGHPGTGGSPVSARSRALAMDGNVRRFLTTGYGPAGDTLGYSDAWLKAGRPDLSVRTIKIGLKTSPKDADLWVALGGALMAASDGMVTPAAQFAFAKARSFVPEHPGPVFFDGLAAAQAGKIEETAQIWMALYDRTPPNALWRQDLEIRLAALAQAVANVPKPANSGPQ
jgi:cytochrome c-type biogenesis protein CcmH